MMRRFFPANRLAQYVGVAEGVTVHDAVEDAHEKLGALREIVVGTIDVKVSMLQGLAMQLNGPHGAELVPEIYALANDIFCDSGVFDFDDLSEGAFQLCDLIAHWRSGAPFNPDAIRVHINAIALLADPRAALGPEERRAIIAGLKRVHNKFADRSETPANEND